MKPAPLPIASARKQTDRRVADRYAGQVPVEVTTAGGIVIAGEVTNVSRSGFRMRSPLIMPRGSMVTVRAGRGARRRARVVWQDGAFVGCRFVRPLPIETLQDMLGADPA